MPLAGGLEVDRVFFAIVNVRVAGHHVFTQGDKHVPRVVVVAVGHRVFAGQQFGERSHLAELRRCAVRGFRKRVILAETEQVSGVEHRGLSPRQRVTVVVDTIQLVVGVLGGGVDVGARHY